MGVLKGFVDMENSREDLFLFPVVFQCIDCRASFGDIKGIVAFVKMDNTAVMEGHRLGCPLFIAGSDFLLLGDKVKGGSGLHMVPDPVVALGGGLGIVKGDTGRNHINQGKSFVRYGCL